MSRKERSATADKSLTVSEYCRQFFERAINNELANGSGASDQAGQKFLNLLRKLQEAGSKDDVKLPLRLLRDEIGRTYFASARQRSEKIETLFKLYDAVEAGAQEDARSSDSKRCGAGNQILEELRQRFTRLVIGDTWDPWPELKLLALRRVHTYAIQEKQQGREATPVSPPPTPSGGGRLGMKMLSRTLSGASGSSVPPTWQAVIDDFSKAPGSRLMPMIKLLLLSTADIPEETKTGLAEEAKEAAAAASNGVPRDGSIEELRPQPSGVSEAADISQRVTGLDMDDLLGLNEAPEEEKPTQEEATKPEEANADPFTTTPRAVPEAMPSVFDSQAGPKGAQPGQTHLHGYPAVSHAGPHHLHSHSSGPLNSVVSQVGSLTPQPSSNPPLSPRMLPSYVSLEANHSSSNRPYFDPSMFEKNAFASQGSYPPPGVMLAPTSSGNLQRADSSGPPGSYYAPGAPLHHQVSGGGQAVGFNAAHGGHLQPMGSTGQAGAYHVHPNNLQPLGSGGQAVGFNKAPGGTMQHVDSSGQTAGFNPFGLSSPTAAAPADDAFATFSPLQPPPPPPVPQPMRAPPQPPAGAQPDAGLRQQHSHGGPSNSLSAW